jgi:perosamine synthetase
MKKELMSSTVKLAKEGGQPIRKTWLPYSRQIVDQDDIDQVSKALRGEIITRGPYVEAFERAVADFVEMPFGVAFSSATAALHAVMAMFQISSGKKVVTSPNTFAATANAVRYCGGEVIFKDVEAGTMNLNPDSLGDLSGVSVVTAVDFAGNPCRYDSLQKFKTQFGFKLVDDASHSLGGSFRGKPIGSQADVSVFSFHPVKSMTTGEGGMVVVRDAKEAEFLRQFRSHGLKRFETPGYYEQEFLGYNYNMTDINCALGLSQLKKLPGFVKRRNELASYYSEHLSKLPLLTVPEVTEGSTSSWHLYALRVGFEGLNVSREDFLRALHAENIGANVHYIPVYFHPYYRNLGYPRGLCPVAEKAYFQEISIPLFPTMTESDARDVVLALTKLLEHFSH